MEAQMIQPMIIPNTPLSAFEIPRKLSTKVIVLLPYCLMLLGADLTFFPSMRDVVTSMESLSKQDPNSLESKEVLEMVLKNVWFLLGCEIFFLSFFWIVSLLSLLAMLYTTSHGELSIKEVFTKSGRSWMRQVITWFYATFIIIVIIVAVLTLVQVSSLKTTGVTLIFLSLVIVLIGTLCYVYLGAVWMFSMVMSIAELDLSEAMVVEKYEELIKAKWFQGFALMLVTSVSGIIMVVALVYGNRNTSSSKSANGIMMLCYVCLLKSFMFLLCIMYCYVSKRKYQKQADASEYSPIEV